MSKCLHIGTMFQNLRKKIRSIFYPLADVPPGFFTGLSEYNILSPSQRALHGPDQALTLSPFWAAMRLFQNSFTTCPLVTYQVDANGGRKRYEDDTVYHLLHDRPNPGMSRADFFEFLVKEYFLHGECFAMLRWANNHRLLGIYPIHAYQIEKVECDEDWNKTYIVRGYDAPIPDDSMIHLKHFSTCGLRGISFLRYAGESLGLHKQVLDSATTYYANAVKPSGWVQYPGKPSPEAKKNHAEVFKDGYGGVINAGKFPAFWEGGEPTFMASTAAADAQIIEAIGASVDDIARWFDNLSPLILGNLSRGTYSNSASDKQAFYAKNMLPLFEKFELEINYKIWGLGSNICSEFDANNILTPDALTQAQIDQIAVTGGWRTPNEIRARTGEPPLPDPVPTPEPQPPVQEGDNNDSSATVDPVSTDNTGQ